MPKLEFWYDFASTYSYLSAMRVEELGREHGVEIVWRPFLLGPIFKAQGWDNSPFSLYPAKGRYMVRDIQRIAAERGLTFRLETHKFPQSSLNAARLGIVAAEEGWAPVFTRELYLLQFRDAENIAEPGTLGRALKAAGQEPEMLLKRIGEQRVKDALRAQSERAAQLGIFGAPTFVTEDGELFWGDDRLERALAWAVKQS
jgi:2-hydroxychromene-2-carboxylate isomerase